MKKKTNVLTIRIPHDLRDRIEKAADTQGISMNQLAMYALTREISDLETRAFFQEQYSGKTRQEIFKAFDAVMEKIPERKAPDWDRLTP